MDNVPPLRITTRWLPLPWGVYGIVLAIVFGGVGVYGWLHPEDGPTVRMVIPLYGVACYWVVACLANRRTVVITPRRLWEVVWPVPVRLPRWTQRASVRHCYLRKVEVYDEGTELERHYAAGVETVGGRQIDVSSYHPREEDATRIAVAAAKILGVDTFEVRQLPTVTERFRRLLLGLFWLAVSLGAIWCGAAWEEEHRLQRAAASEARAGSM